MKKAIKITFNILAWMMLIFALLITIVVFSAERNNGVSNILGYMPMTVESDSMSPTFKKGDLIIVKEVDDTNSLDVDDVITFWTIIDGKRVKNTHRIVEVKESDGVKSYITRGDNNSVDDDMPANPGDIIGKWTDTKLSGFGKVLDFLRTKKGFFICIIIPMAIFFLFELYKFIATLIEVRKPETAEIDEEEIKRRAIEEYLAEQKKKDGGDAASEVKEAAAETAEKAVETVKETVGEKAEKAVETVKETVKDKAEETVEEVKEAVSETVDNTAEKAEEAVENISEKAEEAVSETAEIIEEAVPENETANDDQEK
jgi:signal peptidase